MWLSVEENKIFNEIQLPALMQKPQQKLNCKKTAILFLRLFFYYKSTLNGYGA